MAHTRITEEGLRNIEKGIGIFSNYQTKAGPGGYVQFDKKPAQQLLEALGCKRDADLTLSETKDGKPLKHVGNKDIVIKSFVPGVESSLEVAGERLDRLLSSNEIYINTEILPADYYSQIISTNMVKSYKGQIISSKAKSDDKVEDKDLKDPRTGFHWQNLAVGICHAQEIDLLVAQENKEDVAITSVRGEKDERIDKNAPALLLLSNPALNFSEDKGQGIKLSEANKSKFIRAMYRNLFSIARAKKRTHIVMPAGGLGEFRGDPKTYFEALKKVAQEFPDLTIIYNPAKAQEIFAQVLSDQANVIEAKKDVVFIAAALCKKNIPTVLCNASDADVVFGLYDIGKFWKKGHYVFEEHIASMSTAPLNSRLLNPFPIVIERELTPERQLAEEKDGSDLVDDNMSGLIPWLKNYREDRGADARNIFGMRLFSCFKYTKANKLDAAAALINVLTHNKDDLSPHINALCNGRLGRRIQEFAEVKGFKSAKDFLLQINQRNNVNLPRHNSP